MRSSRELGEWSRSRYTRFAKANGMKTYPDDWRERVFTSVVIATCMAAAMYLGPAVGISYGFWPLMLAVVVAIIVGNVLGRWMFPPSSGPPNHPPRV
jgi:hypothetical protein